MRLLIDNWTARHWLLWPWCALRRHPDTFWLQVRWNGVLTEYWVRCTCGRHGHRDPVRAAAG